MRQGKRPQREAGDHLPGHICSSFEDELKELINSLDFGKAQYQKEQFLSKYCTLDTASADMRRRAAIKKWLSTEKRNGATNSRLYYMAACEYDLGWISFDGLINRVRSIIKSILGPLPEDIFSSGNHTNGASTRVRRSLTAAIDKLTGTAHCSSSAREYWILYARDSILEDQTLECFDASVMFTVPKSTDIDRVACKEPEINMFLQRGVGNYIRDRLLRRAKINLNDQSINRELARVAVRHKLATIDLSSASDSISSGLVQLLLPAEWWSLMDDLRSKKVIIKDYPSESESMTHSLEMFSSMGNGFTFELESLLFYAITRAVCWQSGVKGRISVYGDDIIAPASIVPRLKRIFDVFGFRFNMKKTFLKGPFRESCGGHYYNGVDVTPFYLRGPVTRLTHVIHMLNQLLEWDGRGWGFFTTLECASFHKKWSLTVPQKLWGGNDLKSITSLVTGHAPRKRLILKSKGITVNQDAANKYWHLNRQLTEFPVSSERNKGLVYIVGSFPSYVERTTWTPYIAYDGM